MLRQSVCGAALLVLAVGFLTAPVSAQEPALRTDAQTAARIEAALDSKTTLEFIESPLSEVVQFLSDLHKIDVTIDHRSLDDLGIGTDTPVTTNIQNVTLRSALRLMLDELELDYTIRHGALQITTREATESQLINRVYPVADLIKTRKGETEHFDYDMLAEAIQSTLAPDYWDEVGGPASLDGLLGNLVISQTLEHHRQIAAFLSTYRKLRGELGENGGNKPKSHAFDIVSSPAEVKIRAALDKKISVDFLETPLLDVAEFLRDAANIPVVLDMRGLEDVGIGADTPVTVSAKNARLRDVLGRLLEPLELEALVRDETLQITTPEVVETKLAVRFYPINDLIVGEEEDRGIMMDEIIDVVTSSIAPDTWDSVGGPSSIVVLEPGILVISQMDDTHDQIVTLMSTLREQGVKPTFDGQKIVTRPYVIMDPANPGKTATPEVVEKLVKKVPALVTDVNWSEKGVLLDTFGSTLIIKHTRAAHRKTLEALQSIGASYGFGGGMIPVVGKQGLGGGMGGGGFGGGGLGGGGMFSTPNAPVKK